MRIVAVPLGAVHIMQLVDTVRKLKRCTLRLVGTHLYGTPSKQAISQSYQLVTRLQYYFLLLITP